MYPTPNLTKLETGLFNSSGTHCYINNYSFMNPKGTISYLTLKLPAPPPPGSPPMPSYQLHPPKLVSTISIQNCTFRSVPPPQFCSPPFSKLRVRVFSASPTRVGVFELFT